MEIDTTVGVTFHTFEPICKEILNLFNEKNSLSVSENRKKWVKSMVELEANIKASSTSNLRIQSILDMLLFTLFSGLDLNNNSSSFLTEKHKQISLKIILDILNHCLESNKSSPWSINQSITLIQFFANNILPLFETTSEEFKKQAIEILYLLFQTSNSSSSFVKGEIDPNNLQSFLDKFCETTKSRQMLGYVIFVIVECFSKGKERSLRIKALETLKQMFLNAPSKVMACFLPGILAEITKIITGDYKQGSDVFISAIDCFSVSIISIFNSKFSSTSSNQSFKNKIDSLSSLRLINMKKNQNLNNEQLNTESSLLTPNFIIEDGQLNSWLQSAKIKIIPIFQTLFGSKKEHLLHSKSKVRLSFVNCIREIIYHSSEFCQEIVNSLLFESIVLYVHDEDLQVASEAKKTLFGTNQNTMNDKVWDTLQNNFFQLIQSLPRFIRSTNNEIQTMSVLKLTIGYLSLFIQKPEIWQPLIVSSLSQISSALFQTMEMDIYDIHFEKTFTKNNLTTVSSNPSLNKLEEFQIMTPFRSTNYPRKIFKHFTGEKILCYCQNFIRLMAAPKKGKFLTLLDYFVDVLKQNNPTNLKQTIFIINQLILGTEWIGIEDYSFLKEEKKEQNLVTLSEGQMIIEEYLSHPLWKESNSPNYSIDQMNHNSLSLCLFLEGIGDLAQVLGSQFEDLIQICIYSLVEKLGSSSSVVSQSAWVTLYRISCSNEKLYQKSVKLVLRKNVDYVVDSVISHFRYGLSEFPETPKVLQAVLEFADDSILLVLEDTLDTIFMTLDKNSTGQASFILLQILSATISVLGKRLREQNLQKKLQKNLSPAQLFQESSLLKENSTQQSKKIRSFIIKILEKVQYYLSSSSKEIKLIALDSLGDGIVLLQVQEDSEDSFLPVLNSIWESPLKKRFVDSDWLVQLKSFQVVLKMVQTAANFMQTKIFQEMWPMLRITLNQEKDNMQTIHNQNQSSSLSRNTQILEGTQHFLIELFCFLSPPRTIVSELCYFLLFLLNEEKSPKSVQEKSCELFLQLNKFDPDFVWFFLNQQLGSSFQVPKTLSRSKYQLKNLEFPPAALQQQKFNHQVQSNLKKIISLI